MAKTLALIAHDGKKAEMVAFVKDHLEELSKANLVATGTTGTYIQQTGLNVDLKLSGPKGGDAQIAAMDHKAKLFEEMQNQNMNPYIPKK